MWRMWAISIAWAACLGMAWGQAGIQVSVSSSANPSLLSEPVVLTARVSPVSTAGRVSFYAGIKPLGTALISGGEAKLTTSGLSVGPHRLRAIYQSNVGNTVVRSAEVLHTVGVRESQSFRPLRSVGGRDVASFLLADMNNDGFPDVVSVSGFTVSIDLGARDGLFRPAPGSPITYRTFLEKILVFDIDGDGNLDLINSGATGFVMMGRGDGSLGSAGEALGSQFQIVDYDMDGQLDLLNYSNQGVQWRRGLGNFTVLGAPQILIPGFGIPQRDFELGTADFNGDGLPDVYSRITNSSIAPVRTTLQIRLQGQTEVLTTTFPGTIDLMRIVDLDLDGKLDIIMIHSGRIVRLMTGQGDGRFTVSEGQLSNQVGQIADFLEDIVISDLNGDGTLDWIFSRQRGFLVAQGNQQAFQLTSEFYVEYRRSDGLLDARLGGPFVSPGATQIQVADLNRDGRPDLVFRRSSDARVYYCLGTVATRFAASPGWEGSLAQSTRAGTAFPFQVRLRPLDEAGNPLAGVPVRFRGPAATEPGVSPILGPQITEPTTGSTGDLSLTMRANNLAGGPYSAFFEVANLTPVQATFTNLPGTTASALAVSVVGEAVAGQTVNLRVEVNPRTARGRVIVRTGASQLGSGTLGADGGVTIPIAGLTEGSNAVLVEYAGDSVHDRSQFTLVITARPAATNRPRVEAAGSIVNGATLREGIASGTWITIYGANLSESTRLWQSDDFAGNRLPTALDGVRVTVNGRPAYVYFVSPGQVNVLTPEDPASGSVAVVVSNRNGASAPVMVRKTSSAPGFFAYSPERGRYAIAQDAVSFALIGPAGLLGPGAELRPARAGQVLTMYATGLGQTEPSYVDGEIPAAAPVRNPVRVSIGGVDATVTYAGMIGAGLYQVNLIVPPLSGGDQRVVISVDGNSSPQDVFLAVN